MEQSYRYQCIGYHHSRWLKKTTLSRSQVDQDVNQNVIGPVMDLLVLLIEDHESSPSERVVMNGGISHYLSVG